MERMSTGVRGAAGDRSGDEEETAADDDSNDVDTFNNPRPLPLPLLAILLVVGWVPLVRRAATGDEVELEMEEGVLTALLVVLLEQEEEEAEHGNDDDADDDDDEEEDDESEEAER